ncbi:S8 family serine peptidase [soil metagenome]
MRRIIATTCLIIVLWGAVSAGPRAKYYNKYWVQLSDKHDNGYTLENPSAYLTPRALERRTKFGLEVDSTDLPITESYVNQIAATGAIILHRSRWFNAVSIQITDTNLISTIQALPFVVGIQPVAATTIESIDDCEGGRGVRKNDKASVYGEAYTQTSMVNGHYLHELGFKGEGMYIAVLDAGFENVNTIAAFDSLRLQGRLLGTYDFVRDQENVFDLGSHGRNVLSIMTGNISGSFLGSAPKASYFLFRTEEGASEYMIEEDNWVAAAERADSLGVDLINTSLGYTVYDDGVSSYSYPDMDGKTARISIAATTAARKGLIVVASAGNLGRSAWHYISAPGDADSILTIGAVNGEGNFARFSSYGPTADGRVKPDITGMGEGTSYVDVTGTVHQGNGTSYSAPLLAGFVACLWQTEPTMKPQDLMQLIRQSASTFANPNDSLGYGIPDFQKAHFEILKTQNSVYSKLMPVVYPNPFNDKFEVVINAETPGKYNFEVVDVMGSRVYKEDRTVSVSSFQTFNPNGLGRLAPGLYLVRITHPEGTTKVKVVKW